MPLTDQVLVNSYTGNGVTTVFAYAFKIWANTDLKVTVDGVLKALTTHYTVSGVGADGGGSVTFVTAPASLAVVTVYSESAYSRATDYQDNGDLLAGTLDDDIDKLTRLTQQLRREVQRAIKLPIEETDDKSILTVPASRANKVMAFDSLGALTVKTATDVSSTLTTVGDGLELVSGDLRVVKPLLNGVAAGTVDAITCTVSPVPAALSNGLRILARASGANTSATPTFNLNGLGAKTIVKGSNAALLAADIPGAGFWADFVYDSTLDKWVLQNPYAITLVEHNSNGTHKNPLGGVNTKWGSTVVALNASGDGTITFPAPFATTFSMVVVNNGDTGIATDASFVANQGTSTTSAFNFSVRPSPGAISVRVNWIAIGT